MKFHTALLTITILGVSQALIALLQQNAYLDVEHKYFKLLGSFPSPNYLGAYLGLGFVIIIWYFFINKIHNKWLLSLSIISAFLLITVIILSKSRGTWVSISASIIILIITSKKSISYIKRLSVLKVLLGALCIITITFYGGKSIYSLNTESVSGRGLISKITIQEIIDKPLIGHGLFSFAGGYNKAKTEYFKLQQRPWEEIKVADYVYTAFNDYLLLGYELGLMVLFLITALVLYILFNTNINLETRIGIAIITYFSIWALFNSVLVNVTLLLILIFAVASVFVFGEMHQKFRILKFQIKKEFLVFLVLIIVFTGFYAVGAKFIGVQKFLDYKNGNHNSIDVKKLVNLYKPLENNKNSDFYLGKNLYELNYKKAGFFLMERNFINNSLPTIGKPLAEMYLKEGNYKRAKEILDFNKWVEPYRYEARMDLANLLARTNNYQELVNGSKEIVVFPIKISSSDVNEYKEISKNRIIAYSKYIDSTTNIKGTISKNIIINSEALNKKLGYQIYLPPIYDINKKLPVVYINDGRSYIKNGNTVKILDSLINNKIIEPMAAVFLEPRDGNVKWKNVRNELFSCNPDFTSFFIDELIPNVEKKFPVGSSKNDRTIMGVSFGGSVAAYLGVKTNKTFNTIVMQSPAFKTCPDIYNLFRNDPKKKLNIYLSYGTGNDTERQVVPMIAILKEKNTH
ncbi:alpha/beta hydrolase-fold protein [Cellulophaga baltica 4]|nr:alpha/beta hydrolase-fold protein [Cellulophaga baltica 4]